MVYTMVYTMVYAMVYAMVYTMVYPMVYTMVYTVLGHKWGAKKRIIKKSSEARFLIFRFFADPPHFPDTLNYGLIELPP